MVYARTPSRLIHVNWPQIIVDTRSICELQINFSVFVKSHEGAEFSVLFRTKKFLSSCITVGGSPLLVYHLKKYLVLHNFTSPFLPLQLHYKSRMIMLFFCREFSISRHRTAPPPHRRRRTTASPLVDLFFLFVPFIKKIIVFLLVFKQIEGSPSKN